MLFFVCYRISSIQRTGIGNACVYPLPFFCICCCIRTSAILVPIRTNAHTVSICSRMREHIHGGDLLDAVIQGRQLGQVPGQGLRVAADIHHPAGKQTGQALQELRGGTFPAGP